MALLDKRQCQPCCMELKPECGLCDRKCFPHYLCATVVITPDEYDYVRCHCPGAVTRLFPTNTCAWGGSAICTAPTIACSTGVTDQVDVTVAVMQDEYDNCFTRVTIPNFDDPITDFDGVLPNGMQVAGSIVQFLDDGTPVHTHYLVTIGTYVGAVNPAATGTCPICECVACLPTILCFVFYPNRTLHPNAPARIVSNAVWECDSQSWSSSPMFIDYGVEIQVVISLAQASAGHGCAIAVSIGEEVNYIQLENPLSPDGTGISCLEGGATITRGAGGGKAIETTTNINASMTFTIGGLSIVDSSCGDCNFKFPYCCKCQDGSQIPPQSLFCTLTTVISDTDLCTDPSTAVCDPPGVSFGLPYGGLGEWGCNGCGAPVCGGTPVCCNVNVFFGDCSGGGAAGPNRCNPDRIPYFTVHLAGIKNGNTDPLCEATTCNGVEDLVGDQWDFTSCDPPLFIYNHFQSGQGNTMAGCCHCIGADGMDRYGNCNCRVTIVISG